MGTLHDDVVQLVEDDLVPSIVAGGVILGEVEASLWKVLLDPLLEGEELQNGSIRDRRVEVGVIKRVSAVCKGDS